MDVDIPAVEASADTGSAWRISTYRSKGHTYIVAVRGAYTVIVDDHGTLARAFASYQKEYCLPAWKDKKVVSTVDAVNPRDVSKVSTRLRD